MYRSLAKLSFGLAFASASTLAAELPVPTVATLNQNLYGGAVIVRNATGGGASPLAPSRNLPVYAAGLVVATRSAEGVIAQETSPEQAAADLQGALTVSADVTASQLQAMAADPLGTVTTLQDTPRFLLNLGFLNPSFVVPYATGLAARTDDIALAYMDVPLSPASLPATDGLPALGDWELAAAEASELVAPLESTGALDGLVQGAVALDALDTAGGQLGSGLDGSLLDTPALTNDPVGALGGTVDSLVGGLGVR